MSTRTILSALVALAIIARASAQEAAPATPAEPAAPAVTVAGPEPAHTAATRDKDTLSVDFPDEEIKTILRNVADLFELNLVVPDTLTGRTSIKLRDVTWRQIFQVVLSPVNYSFIEEGNIIKIVSNEALTQEPVSTEVFILNNAKAADIKPTIDGLVDAAAGGKILIDARSNALVITERPSRMGRVRQIIDKLDKATDQVMIESKFVEVTDRDIRNMGVNWASLQGMQFGVSGINQTFSRGRNQTRNDGTTQNNGTSSTSSSNSSTGSSTTNTNGTSGSSNVTNIGGQTSVVSTTTTGSQLTTQSVTTIDPVTNNPVTTTSLVTVPTNTSSTTTTTTAPTTQTNSSTGTTSSSSTSTNNSLGSTLNNTVNSALNSLTGLTNTASTGRLSSAVFSASDFNIIVSALKTQNNAKVVSNPTVVTLNNTEAILNIGSEFPIPSYTYNSERGTFEVSGFTYKPIGVILKVTPQVNARGVVKLVLEPEVSQQADSTSFGGAGGASIPIISTRKVKTQVSLASGQTVGIGGLISSAKSHGGTKVPLLGDIPGLGKLFSSKNVNDTVTNLLIFVTAKVIDAEGASPSDVFSAAALESVNEASVPAKK